MKRKKKIRRIPKKIQNNKRLEFTYKDVDILKQFVTEQGSLVSRVESGLSQKYQRKLAIAVKRARHLALLPFTQTV